MSSNETKPTSTDPKDNDLLLDHAYDGIQEFDNPMPRWWVWTFWATFWFSCAYLFHYWAGNGVSVADTYAADVAEANAIAAKEAMASPVTEESLAKLMADGGSTEAGKAIFAARCAACHMAEGQGSIGPNLTDSSWIHGKGQLMDLYETASNGVAAKGMPAWNRQLTPTELRQVVAFVGTLRNTNVPGKAAEGTPVQ
jgi:cytochrome c oxidase cbb3-type subunit III